VVGHVEQPCADQSAGNTPPGNSMTGWRVATGAILLRPSLIGAGPARLGHALGLLGIYLACTGLLTVGVYYALSHFVQR